MEFGLGWEASYLASGYGYVLVGNARCGRVVTYDLYMACWGNENIQCY